MTSLPSTHLLCPNPSSIQALCLGSGRFLRSVLVPALSHLDFSTAILQTRGRSFLDYTRNNIDNYTFKNDGLFEYSYPVDTVHVNGDIETESISYGAAGTLGSLEGKEEANELIGQMKSIVLIGVGVTEAGLSSFDNPAMKSLADILKTVQLCMEQKSLVCPSPKGKICIINMDNVPGNGDLIKSYMIQIANQNNDKSFLSFLNEKVSFHNTMVDRITSQRDGSNGLIPRAEPVPAKALVIEDLDSNLPPCFSTPELKSKFGVVVRTLPNQLKGDIALKLRVANGTHTAIAHVMALTRLLTTDELSKKQEEDSSSFRGSAQSLMAYLDSMFDQQILVAGGESFGKEETEAVYQDWRKRLIHAHFGLSAFFITQNGAAKGGIRMSPTVRDLIASGKKITCTTIFAYAAILRFLTPAVPVTAAAPNGIFRGWMDDALRIGMNQNDNGDESVTYADGLSYNLKKGWYEFRCSCKVNLSQETLSLPAALGSFASPRQPYAYEQVIRGYLKQEDGGDLSDIANDPATSRAFDLLVRAIAGLYARMVAGDGMLNILQEMMDGSHIYEQNGFATSHEVLVDGVGDEDCVRIMPLHYMRSPIPCNSNLMKLPIAIDKKDLKVTVFSEVASASIIDLHTHLLPPSHGMLCLWGIDELLTYHYLVAEFFMTAPATLSPEEFYSLNKQKQADLIWGALFLERSPISEACRGVITTLKALGLEQHIINRDLDAIRTFFSRYRDEGKVGAEKYCNLVRNIAGIRYAIMTNIPFDPTESRHWRPTPKEYSSMFRSAVRVDPLLAGDRETIETALAASGYERTIEGARQYLHDWCETMKPEYMMASTPHNFTVPIEKGMLSGFKKTGLNEEAMKEPFAFIGVGSSPRNDCDVEQCNGENEGVGSLIDENSDFLSEVLIKVCEERDLPIALKIGARRSVNPSLLQAGDGVVGFADAEVLARLCTRFPKVRFLATFLSRNNQHEACVLASKFRNLHLYGCWWFCNNPSIITEISRMRLEMLGTAFTAQHSDARVIDQLIYKWAHSRCILADILRKEYMKLVKSGWNLTREEIRRDVNRLFGSSYEEFMSKSFAV